MCTHRKRIPYTPKNRERIKQLPKIYVIACWAHVGFREFPFAGKYTKEGIPLVYYFDDHNGEYWEYVLLPITHTTTGRIYAWTTCEFDLLEFVKRCDCFKELCEKGADK